MATGMLETRASVGYTSRSKSTVQSGGEPKKAQTFKRKALNGEFEHFCQLSTEAEDRQLSESEFAELREASKEFIGNPDFSSRSAERDILGDVLLSAGDSEGTRSKRLPNLPTHLAGMCEASLLTAEQERILFQRMNYLRFRASQIVEKHTAATMGQWDVERVRGLLRAANWHRDRIVNANTRLVISIVKKFVNPHCCFDDLLSDGIMALLRSIDKYDFQLGFRFSTYATQVIRRNSYRFVMERQDDRLKVTTSLSDGNFDVEEEVFDSGTDELRRNRLLSVLGELLDNLDKREKLIIRARFALGGHRRVQTLQRLADRLGISKERVRQIEKRAMEKLAVMADNRSIDLALPA